MVTSSSTLQLLTGTLCNHRSPWNTLRLLPPCTEDIHPTIPTGSLYTSRDTLPGAHHTSTHQPTATCCSPRHRRRGSIGRSLPRPPSSLSWRIKMTATTRQTKMEKPACGMFEHPGRLHCITCQFRPLLPPCRLDSDYCCTISKLPFFPLDPDRARRAPASRDI